MKVESIIEHEDGSATLQMDMSAEEVGLLIESAFRIALIEGLKLSEDKRMKEWEDERQEAKPDNWVGLTDEEIMNMEAFYAPSFYDFYAAIEAKLKEKNT